jgi:predicted N-formylglutamate amidohydrolase
MILTCEHASRGLPFRAALGRGPRRILASHWGWDIGAWALTLHLVRRLRLEAVGGRWSRLWIDLNRRGDDPTLIRATAEGVELPWNQRLTPAEVEHRLLAYHTPYHLALDAMILHRLVRGIRPTLLAIHTFTPLYEGRVRTLDVGVLYDRDRGLARRLGRSLRRSGLDVRYNQPYSGLAGMMYAVDRHGGHHRLPCLELEVNQRLLDSPRAIARVGSAVAAAIGECVGSGGR